MSASMTPRASRFVQVLADQCKESAVAFLQAAVGYYATLGVRIERVMTDNGSCYQIKDLPSRLQPPRSPPQPSPSPTPRHAKARQRGGRQGKKRTTGKG